MFDDLGGLDRHLVRDFRHNNGFRHMHVLDNSFDRRLEIAFALFVMHIAATLRSYTPGIATTGSSITASLHAADTALLGDVVLPSRRDIGRLDRLLADGGGRFLLANLLVYWFVQRAFGRPGRSSRCRFGRLHHTARRTHHGLDLGYFVLYSLTGTLGGSSTLSSLLRNQYGFLLCFFHGSTLLFFLKRIFRSLDKHGCSNAGLGFFNGICRRLSGLFLGLLRFQFCS